MRDNTIYLTLEITCGKDDHWFNTTFNDLPQSDQDIITKRNGIPCGGGGVMGQWCRDCPFVERYSEEWSE